MRAFLAVTVSEPALGPLNELRARLAASVGGVRWARDDGLHVTLRFFGDLDEALIDPLMARVGDAVAGAEPFDLALSGLGSFPGNPRYARVLWVGVSAGHESLRALFDRVDGAAGTAGLGREARPFAPHCTLGRARSQWPGAHAWADATGAGCVLPAFAVRAVDLYESRDGYHRLRSVAIGPAL